MSQWRCKCAHAGGGEELLAKVVLQSIAWHATSLQPLATRRGAVRERHRDVTKRNAFFSLQQSHPAVVHGLTYACNDDVRCAENALCPASHLKGPELCPGMKRC